MNATVGVQRLARALWARIAAGLLAILLAPAALAFSSGTYYPLPDGASWTYSSSLNGTVTSTVTGSGDFNGATVRIVHDSTGDESFYTNGAQGVYLHGALFADPVNGNEIDVYTPPVKVAAPETSVGAMATGSGTVTAYVGGMPIVMASYSSTATVVGLENVTVPAGTFQDAVHVQLVVNLTYGITWQQTVDLWLARGIGAVKSVTNDSSAGTTDTQLLTSYSVPDIVPDAFSFAPQSPPPYTLVYSDPISVSGIDAPSPIEVVGGQYNINGGAFTSAPGTVGNGDQVTVSATAPAAGNSTTTTLYIGGLGAGFTVTGAADTTPNPFAFVAVAGASPGMQFTSNRIVLSGTDGPAPISIAGGEYSINGAAFTSAPDVVPPGATLRLRVTASPLPGTSASAVVTIGGVSGSFSVTTAAPGDGPRSLLYFESQYGDYIGGGDSLMFNVQDSPAGTTTTLTPSVYGDFSMSQTVDGVPGYAHYFYLNLAVPDDKKLAPGRYEGAERFGSSTVPGLDFFGDGRGCNAVTGRFDVLEAAYDSSGAATRFAANFEQHCEGGTPALYGQIRYNSDIPLGGNTFRRWRGDFNADGRGDILWRNGGNGDDYIFFMNGTAVAAGSGYTNSVPDTDWQIVGTGDFDGDGVTDILWRKAGTGENYIFLMDGTTVKAGSGYTNTVGGPWTVAGVGDFDGDGKADILWRNATTGEDYVFLIDGTSVKAGSGYTSTVDGPWTVAGVADFDGDGKADILWRNATTGEDYVFLMNGATVLGTSSYTNTVGGPWTVAGVGDFDGDGKADILWRNATTGENYVFLMSGTAVLGSSGYTNSVPDQDWQVAGTGDYDGDGRADILWRNGSSGDNYLFLMNATTVQAGSNYTNAVPDTDWQVQNP